MPEIGPATSVTWVRVMIMNRFPFNLMMLYRVKNIKFQLMTEAY